MRIVNEDSESLLTQMTEKFGGDDEEGQGDEGEEASQAPRPTATVTSGASLAAAEHTDGAEEEVPPLPPQEKQHF